MARKPKPSLFRGWYTTEAGGQGRVKLCRESEGIEEAERKLAAYLESLDVTQNVTQPDEPAIIGPRVPVPVGVLTIGQFVERFMRHAKVYYRLPSGKPSKEVDAFELSFRELRGGWRAISPPGKEMPDGLADLGVSPQTIENGWDHLPAASFGKRDLKTVRELMIAADLSRKLINQRISRIVRAFRWGAENEHVPDQVAAALLLVRPLQRGRCEARETEDVEPVSIEDVTRTLTEVGVVVGEMIRLQLLTGLRPGEVCALRRKQIDTGSNPWRIIFGVTEHKMGYKGKEKIITLGPKATEQLRFLIDEFALDHDPELTDWYFFRPSEASKSKDKSKFRECYTVQAYNKAIRMACRRAGVPTWTANQLRHSYATAVRARFGLEAAQVMLGHASASVTQIYAERDKKLGERVAEELG